MPAALRVLISHAGRLHRWRVMDNDVQWATGICARWIEAKREGAMAKHKIIVDLHKSRVSLPTFNGYIPDAQPDEVTDESEETRSRDTQPTAASSAPETDSTPAR